MNGDVDGVFELRSCFLESDERDRFRALASRYSAIFRRMRLNIRWPVFEPEPGVYHMDDLDAAVSAIKEAGMEPYVNVVDAPAHALGYCDADGKWTPYPWEGYRSYFPTGSAQIVPTCWNKAAGVWAAQYDVTNAPECANPPRVMPDAVRRMASALAKHCGGKVDRFGIGNEMDSPSFFPLWILVVTKYGDNWEPVTRMIYNDVTRPFSLGIHEGTPEGAPKAFIEANESQTYGMLATTLKIEKELGDHLIDGITTHGYGTPFPEAAIKRITAKDGGLLQYLIDSGAWDGRPWGIGEVAPSAGDDPMSVIDYLPVMKQLGAGWVTLLMGEALFTPGTYTNATYEPNDVYRALEAQASRFANSRHRAVRS